MKDLKSTLIQHFILSASLLALALTFIAAPPLQLARAQFAELTGVASSHLWLLMTLLMVGASYLQIKRLIATIAQPMSRLVQEAEHGEQGFAFKIKSRSREEDALKHGIEAAKLRAKEAREQADELETALESANQSLAASHKKYADAEASFTRAEKEARELRIENEKLKGSNIALELTLENERKAKVGLEVEKRTDEIFAQMERAVSAAAYKSIWLPSLVAELKTPIAIINQLSSGLKGSWSEASMARVSDEIGRICEQSEVQLGLLEDILSRQPKLAPQGATRNDVANGPAAEPAKRAGAEQPPAPSPISLLDEHDDEELEKEAPISPLFADLFKPADSKTASFPQDPDMNADIVAQLQGRLDAALSHPLPTPSYVKERPAKPASEYSLRGLLQNLAEEFGAIAENANITYSIDEDVDAVIEDNALLSLLHTLVEIAVSHLKKGDITIGVDLHSDSIEFDVACDGRFKDRHDLDLDRARQLAADLGSEVLVDMAGESELHLTFRYSFAPSDSDAAIDV